jgi:tetratricopeptide (TPR) repeat protein
MQKALSLDPDYPEAHNAIAILLHLAFNRPEEAIQHYKKALELRPAFSEARTNLANVYLSQSRYDEAIKLYEESLNDMLYPTPYIAQGNLGWALYKKGETERALQSIRAAVTTNPGFCLGYKNLGIIHDETGNVSEACRSFGRYREACPDVADAYLREGACQVKLGKVEEARQNFTVCEAKAKSQALKDDCRRLLEAL